MSLQTGPAAAKQGQPAWLQRYIDSPDQKQQLFRRTMFIIVLSQILGGAGLAAGITVGALLAQEMLGTNSLAGVPVALLTLGSAGGAWLVGRLSQRYGRRIGLTTGFMTGGVGAAGVVLAASLSNIYILFISLLIYGVGTATNLQARYAGTDLANTKQRATAISTAMVFTTFGAVAGPNLVEVMGNYASSIGLPSLSGPFMLAGAAYLLAGLVLFLLLRPDPLIVATAIAAAKSTVDMGVTTSASAADKNRRGVILGASVMVITQTIMVAIMTMTPIHMGHHGHSLSNVGLVIGIHVGAMYLPSLVTGMLVNRVGRNVMAIASVIILLAAGILAAAAPGESTLAMIIALALLGLGWNFGLISGTTIIVDATSPATRAKTQGSVDVLIALAGASGGALSGMVVAQSSFASLSLSGAALSLLLVPIIVWSRKQSQ